MQTLVLLYLKVLKCVQLLMRAKRDFSEVNDTYDGICYAQSMDSDHPRILLCKPRI